MDFYFKLNTSWVVENVLWTSPDQDNVRDYQCFFHNTIDFQYIIHINFHILKFKNNIYCAHTSVDPSMSTMGDISCRHPNHCSRANISQTTSVEWIIISLYATSNTGRPYELVILRNHHCVLMTSHQHKNQYIDYHINHHKIM